MNAPYAKEPTPGAGENEMIEDHTSLGRFGETSDIAAVVAYLAFDESRWVTAQVIEASRGYKL